MSETDKPCWQGMTIHQRLHAAMEEVSRVAKNITIGEGKNKYSAVGHDDVVAAARPALLKWGVVCWVTISEADEKSRDFVDRYNNTKTEFRTEIWCESQFVCIEATEETFATSRAVRSYAVGVDSSDKGSGKAISYATKYSLMKCLMLATGEDSDMQPSEPTGPAQNPPPASNEEMLRRAEIECMKARFKALGEAAGTRLGTVLWSGVKADQLSAEERIKFADEAIKMDESLRAAAGDKATDELINAFAAKYENNDDLETYKGCCARWLIEANELLNEATQENHVNEMGQQEEGA